MFYDTSVNVCRFNNQLFINLPTPEEDLGNYVLDFYFTSCPGYKFSQKNIERFLKDFFEVSKEISDDLLKFSKVVLSVMEAMNDIRFEREEQEKREAYDKKTKEMCDYIEKNREDFPKKGDVYAVRVGSKTVKHISSGIVRPDGSLDRYVDLSLCSYIFGISDIIPASDDIPECPKCKKAWERTLAKKVKKING